MHPKLRIENLKRLPPSIRKLAEVACGPHRSFEDAGGSRMHSTLSRILAADRDALYSIFYANLDPVRIPGPDQLESLRPETSFNISAAAKTLETIFRTDPPMDVAIAAWPRIWPWFEFICTYRDYLPRTPLDLLEPAEFLIHFLRFTGSFKHDSYAILIETPGFAGMIARAWRLLSSLEEPLVQEMAHDDLCRFMICFTHGQENINELVEGAGGAMEDLGGLVVAYLGACIHRPPVRISSTLRSFRVDATPRLEQIEEIDGNSSSMRACDNSQCGDIRDKSELERCSGCLAFYYCSQTCQIHDWRLGGHRRSCRRYGYLGLTSRVKSALGARERAFLHALLDRDYKHRLSICVQQVAFMVAHSDELFLTSFDYSLGAVNITVESAMAASDVMSVANSVVMSVAGPEWTDTMRRAAESEGRLQLHAMRIPEGTALRCWVVPLRASSGTTHRKLRDAAKQIGTGGKNIDVAGEVQAILQEKSGVLEIH
ncbi:hypothetical protein DFH09DRAFT_1472597 [Mycena vulgaris]|nr:hypothetical protein DFH09DRAFT_1472597 [Mycena vulgaris]